MITVEMSAIAEADLRTIILHTKSEWGIDQAKLVKVKLQSAIVFLIEFPECGRATKQQSVRARVVPKLPFVILYKLNTEKMTIIQILHTKRKR